MNIFKMDDWQNHITSISKKAQHILNNKLFCDCEFIIGQEKVKCHKLILAMGSPVFQAMFFGSNINPNFPIPITDIDYQVFLQTIGYIYGQEINISSHKNACELFYAAKKYIISFLEHDCIEYLKNNLNHENVLSIYEFAKFHDEKSLMKQCISEIQLNTVEVLQDKGLCDISEETLKSILDLNLMNIPTELNLFRAVEKWALFNFKGHSNELLKKDTHGILSKLRLLTLSVEEFAEGPANSKLLTDAEKLALLLRITNGVKTSMDNGLCEVQKKRKPANFKCISILDITALQDARCDGSEWLTSIFTTNCALDLLGVEIRLQVNEESGEYFEDIMVKIGYAHSQEHFAEGNLCGLVEYNSKAEIILNTAAYLEPLKEYAIHVFLCRPGMYPIGNHTNHTCKNESVIINFVSHSSWLTVHPYNTTIISSIIYTDNSSDSTK